MALSEFSIIERYFSHLGAAREDVVLGVGDDAALLEPRPGHCVVAASRTIHLPEQDAAVQDPAAVAWGIAAAAVAAVAVQGGQPAWLTLVIALDAPDEDWLAGLRRGLADLCEAHGLAVIGGDTTRGPRRVTVMAHGQRPAEWPAPTGPAPGDLLYVTADLGGPGLALLERHGEIQLPRAAREAAHRSLDFPVAPVTAALELAALGTSVATLEDGLAAALSELLEPHGLGAAVHADALPVAAILRPHLDGVGGRDFLLQAGSGLGLAIVAGAGKQATVEAACARHGLPCAWVGLVERRTGLRSHE